MGVRPAIVAAAVGAGMFPTSRSVATHTVTRRAVRGRCMGTSVPDTYFRIAYFTVTFTSLISKVPIASTKP